MRFLAVLISIQLCASVANSASLEPPVEQERLTSMFQTCIKLSHNNPSLSYVMPMYLGKEWRTVLEVDNISGTKDRDYCYPEKTGAWRTIQNGIEKPANVQENATVSLSLIPGSPRVSYPIVPHSAEKSARVAHGTRVLIQQYTLTCGSVHFKAQYFKRMVWDRVGSQREESFVTGNFSGSCDKDEERSPFSSLSEAAKNKEALPDTTSLGALVQPTNSSISQESTPETDGVHDTNESSPILGKYGIGGFVSNSGTLGLRVAASFLVIVVMGRFI